MRLYGRGGRSYVPFWLGLVVGSCVTICYGFRIRQLCAFLVEGSWEAVMCLSGRWLEVFRYVPFW
jgi:hypothetical protein